MTIMSRPASPAKCGVGYSGKGASGLHSDQVQAHLVERRIVNYTLIGDIAPPIVLCADGMSTACGIVSD